MPQWQQTISSEVSLSGPGLFSGEKSTITICPAAPNTGITFIRQQGEYMAEIPALVQNLLKRPRRTSLRNGTLSVETIEHVMAALNGMGIHNALIRISGGLSGEMPSVDGSSRAFVQAINQVGIQQQEAPLSPLIIRRPVQVTRGDSTIAALPGDPEKLEIIYDFEAPSPIGRQVFAFQLGDDDFAQQIAPARTFVFEHEVRELRERGLGRHLTAHDLLVIGPEGPIDNDYRFPDECARHKVLDIIGDLYLAGRPIRGRIFAHKSGHELNHLLVRRLLEQQEAADRESLITRDAAMDIRKIQRIMPHRYPMLLVDRVMEIVGDQKAVGVKNVSFNEPFFQGHYPGTPVMPGVLILEALAQLGGLLLCQKLEHTGKIPMLVSMDKVKLRHPVTPGDQLLLEALTIRARSRTGHVRCKAFVGDKLAAEAEIKFMLVDAEPV